jgi:hypothetical protein
MFWNLKAHMQAASTLATAHYPETLDRIFIIGAPYFFSTVWGWIKRWFDPVTVSKIFILSASEVKPTLEQFIEPRNIPKAYGGELDFEFFARPNVDPKIKETLTWENGFTDFPEGPAYWVPVDGGKRLACYAVGSKGGQERRERVCSIPVAHAKREGEAAAAGAGADAPAANSPAVDGSVEAAVGGMQNLTVSEDKTASEIEEKVAAEPGKPQAEQEPASVAA